MLSKINFSFTFLYLLIYNNRLEYHEMDLKSKNRKFLVFSAYSRVLNTNNKVYALKKLIYIHPNKKQYVSELT